MEEKKTFLQWFWHWQRSGFCVIFLIFLALWFGINLAGKGYDFWDSEAFKMGSVLLGAVLLVFMGATYKQYKEAKKRGGVL